MRDRHDQALDFTRVADAVSRAMGLPSENPILVRRSAMAVARLATILLARWRYNVPYATMAEMLGYKTHHEPLRLYTFHSSNYSSDVADVLDAATRILDGEV